MTSVYDEGALRHWLVDYLVTNIGCSPDDIDLDASMNDLGLGSRDAVVLSGELSELLGRTCRRSSSGSTRRSPTLVRFLTDPESAADRRSRSRRPDHGSLKDEPIAVIGLGCRFPGGIHGPDALWKFLVDGRLPSPRYLPRPVGSPSTTVRPKRRRRLPRTTRWGSFLDDIDAFDADFFEISPREADKMDPQQRLLLEVAWEALEHAGIPAELAAPLADRRLRRRVRQRVRLPRGRRPDQRRRLEQHRWRAEHHREPAVVLPGPARPVGRRRHRVLVVAGRRPPGLPEPAHRRLRPGARRRREPDAVARGLSVRFDQAGALSPTGACHAFDAAADGFVRGEGCGVVVLKRLTDALRDGDRVLAVVRGSAVNQDGRSNGLMAPNPAAQMAVLRAAYANAGVPPHEVDYVEAHGTGTLLGDPIEARALGAVLGRGRPEDAPLLIGAVKTNLGHLEARGRCRGLHQGGAGRAAGQHPGEPALPEPESAHSVRRAAAESRCRADRIGRTTGASAPGRGVVVRLRRHQRARGDRAGPAAGRAGARQVDPAGDDAGGVGQDRRSGSPRLAAALADWMDGAGAEVALADVAHTLNHHRARHAKFATVVRARPRAGGGRPARPWPRASRAAAWSARTTGRAGRARCSSTPGRVRSGPAWAGNCWPTSRLFAAAVAELEPVFVEQVGFSLHDVLAERRTGQR